jgi:hypothetical protein
MVRASAPEGLRDEEALLSTTVDIAAIAGAAWLASGATCLETLFESYLICIISFHLTTHMWELFFFCSGDLRTFSFTSFDSLSY